MADGNGEWWAVGASFLGVLGWMLRQAAAVGRLVRRVEDCEAKVEAIDCMSREDCKQAQAGCRDGMFRELERFRQDLTDLKDLIRQGEMQRDKARREDMAWRQEMRDMLIEVRTRLAEHLQTHEDYRRG